MVQTDRPRFKTAGELAAQREFVIRGVVETAKKSGYRLPGDIALFAGDVISVTDIRGEKLRSFLADPDWKGSVFEDPREAQEVTELAEDGMYNVVFDRTQAALEARQTSARA